MKAFITGVTGFVGTYLAEYLVSCGDEVCGASRRGTWAADVSPELRHRVPVLAWDIGTPCSDELRLRLIRFAPDVIFHLAAISVPGECGADQPTLAAIESNVGGTREVVQLAQALAETNNCRPRVVFTSSCYVYGSVPQDDPIVTEEAPCRPIHGYGITKLAAEDVLLYAAKESPFDFVVARAFQHSGPRQSPQMVLPDWARQLAQGAPTVRAICLDTFLDISDVRDVVQAYRALGVSGRTATVYNVGSGVNYRAGDLLNTMRTIWPTQASVLELSPGRRQHPIADIRRIVTDTGWRPTIPIAATLTDILNYWKQRERGS